MEGKGGEMVGKVESFARRATACVLTVLLVVGLLPTLPEVPRAFAEESKAVQLGGGKDGGATTDASIKTESDDAVVFDENVESAILGQLEQIAEKAEAQGAGTYGPMQTEKVVPEAGIQSNKVDEDEAILEAQSESVASSANVSYQNIKVGDKITLGRYQGQAITWVCVAINEHGPLMLSEKTLCNKAFDANGEDNTYHSDGWGYIRKSYGSNCWRDSNLRQWLNTSGVVNWSHCAPTSQRVWNGLNAYDAESGFLTGFTEDELAAIKSVSRIVNVNSWEASREGYTDGGFSKISFDNIASGNLSDEQRQQYYYQRIEDRIFLLGPDELYAAWQNASDTLLAEQNKWWLGIAKNTGASYENVSTFDPTANSTQSATGYTNAYDGSVGVRPAFYLDVMSIHLMNGYNFERDKYSFKNFPLKNINPDYFNTVFHSAAARILYGLCSTIAAISVQGGVCYGLANATHTIKSGCPSLDGIKNIWFDNDGNIDFFSAVDGISSILYDSSCGESPTYLHIGKRAVPFIDFVVYNHVFQLSPHALFYDGAKNRMDYIFNKIKNDIDSGDSAGIIKFEERKKSLIDNDNIIHSVFVVGYGESSNKKAIFVHDSNVPSRLCEITIENDWSWSYDAPNKASRLNSSNCDLSRQLASTLPYTVCVSISKDMNTHKWPLWNNALGSLGDTSGGLTDAAPYEDGSLLVGVDADGYEMESGHAVAIEPTYGNSPEMQSVGEYGDLYWASSKSPVKIAKIKANDGKVMVAEGAHIVTASASDESSVNLEKTKEGTRTNVESSDGAIVTVKVEDVISDTSTSTLNVVGTAAKGLSSVDTIGDGYLVDGLQDLTLTLTNDNGSTDEVIVANENEYTLKVHVDENNAAIDAVPIPAFRTQSLTLGGTIGVNFYADLSPLTDEEREGCRATFAVNGRTYEDGYDAGFVNKKGYHGFTCPITSVEMADEITATLSWGDGESVTKTYSVAGYMETFEQYASSFDETTRALVRSVADYGHYVQPFLARERGWEVGKDHKEMPAASTWAGIEAEWKGAEADEAEAASAGYAISRELPEGCGFAVPTQSLVLDSGTDLCLYVVCEEGVSLTGAVLADGTKLACERMPDGRWRVTIPGVRAHELGKQWEVRISSSAGMTGTVRTSALAWVRSALVYDAWREDQVARDAAASIWRYAKAAEAYRAAHPQG